MMKNKYIFLILIFSLNIMQAIDIQLGNIIIDSTEKNILYTFENHPTVLLKPGKNAIISKFFEDCLQKINYSESGICKKALLLPQSENGKLLNKNNQLIIEPLYPGQKFATVIINYLSDELNTILKFSVTNLSTYLNYDLYFDTKEFERLLFKLLSGQISGEKKDIAWYQLNFAFNPYGSFLSDEIVKDSQRPIDITSIVVRYKRIKIPKSYAPIKHQYGHPVFAKPEYVWVETVFTRNNLNFDQFLTGLTPQK
ncbi:MAG: hypothetical protein WDZ41_01675 [Candidatus Babeliales bacterium]